MFKLTIEADTIEMLQRKLMAARHAFGITVTSVNVEQPTQQQISEKQAAEVTTAYEEHKEVHEQAAEALSKPKRTRTPKAPSVEPATTPAAEPVPGEDNITVEGLQRLCAEVSAIVGMPAVKAMIAGLGVSSVREMTPEMRDTLAGKLRNRHE